MLTWGEGLTGAAPNLHPIIFGFQALSQVGRPPLVSWAQTDRPCGRQRGGWCKFPTLCQIGWRRRFYFILMRFLTIGFNFKTFAALYKQTLEN